MEHSSINGVTYASQRNPQDNPDFCDDQVEDQNVA
jgi:hypothetical protein